MSPFSAVNVYAPFTFAGLPPAAAWPPGLPVWVTDLGVGPGVAMMSNGLMWLPIAGDIPLIQSATARLLLGYSSATMNNNGAFTGVTALPRQPTVGAYVYWVANSIYSGSAAGWYWTTFSSTTAGTVYNNTWTVGTKCVPPASPTAFVCTGAGTISSYTTSEITAAQVTIPGGLLGPLGCLDLWMGSTQINNSNNKTVRVRTAGNASFNTSKTTSSKDYNAFKMQWEGTGYFKIIAGIPVQTSSTNLTG